MSATFPYVSTGSGGPQDLPPLMPLTLRSHPHTVDVMGLVDSGASVNVLPYAVGLQLGGDWDSLPHTIPVSGGVGSMPGKLFVAQGIITNLPIVPLIFAWVKTNSVRVILGQVNFFHEFDVCFFRKRGVFEVRPATP